MIYGQQALAVQFTVSGSSGLVDADATPSAVLVVDGADTATPVTVTRVATGVYKASCTLPSLTAGQSVSVRVSADVAGVPLGAVVFSDLVGYRVVSPVDWTVIDASTLDTSGLALGATTALATVTAYLASDTQRNDPIAQTTADGDGDWSLTVPPGATYTLWFEKAGYRSASRTVEVA